MQALSPKRCYLRRIMLADTMPLLTNSNAPTAASAAGETTPPVSGSGDADAVAVGVAVAVSTAAALFFVPCKPSELLIVRWGNLRYEAFICNLALFYENNPSEYGTLRWFFQTPHHLSKAVLGLRWFRIP